MRYVDGYVLPIPKKNIQAYRRLARKAGKIWREHGALEYRGCVGDDLNVKTVVPFPRSIRLKRGETVVFSWIVFKSRAHRDRVNASVMKDPRLAKIDSKSMPFDFKRMVYGGFKVYLPTESRTYTKKKDPHTRRPMRHPSADPPGQLNNQHGYFRVTVSDRQAEFPAAS